MRWFFLLVLLFLGIVTNMAVFDTLNLSRAIAGLALNFILIALWGFWFCAYWLSGQARDRGVRYAISLLFLGLAVAIGQYALELLISNRCPSVRERGRVSPLARLFNVLIDAGYCNPVLLAYLLGSVSLLAFAARTFHQARR